MTKLKNTTPSQQRRYVKSASHNASRRDALKSRLTRSGLRVAAGSAIVVRHGFATAFGALQAVCVHEAPNAVAADAFASPQQRLPSAPVAVGVVVGGVHLADALEQPLLAEGARGALTGSALGVRGRRHVQDPADRR